MATLYKSTDPSAPVLTGSAGALISVLDACLVNGYGSQAAAGWTKPYSGTNKAVYRMGTSGNTGFYLNIQDNAPVSGRDARAWGYEVASAQDTGTGQFPTTSQLSTGVFIRKSNTADSTARAWYLLADSSCFYLFIESGDFVTPTHCTSFAFGDFYTYKSGDAYNCAIYGRVTENSSSVNIDNLPVLQGLYANTTLCSGTFAGHYLARSWTGLGSSVNFSKHTSAVASATSFANTCAGSWYVNNVPYPNGPDGSLLLAPIWIGHNNAVRGYLKGLWAPGHYKPLAHGDTFSGTGAMAGKSFLALWVKGFDTNTSNDAYSGQMILETSNTWS
ncbi:MAG: hypothetical protein PHY45_00985 [Rhodocyclaceae bacterium]|nr:hypothetical protein [Rhodocyclaceae bacterium]